MKCLVQGVEMTKTGFAKSLSFAQFRQVFMFDLRNCTKHPISMFRLAGSATLAYLVYRSVSQALFIRSEFTPETDDERRERHIAERQLRLRNDRSFTDGERDLSRWQEMTKHRLDSLLR